MHTAGYESTGQLVRMVSKILMGIRSFLLLIVIVVLGFTAAFHLIFRTEKTTTANEDFMDLTAVVQVYQFMLDGTDLSQFKDASTVWLAFVFYVVYTGFVSVVLLNLLISIMSYVFAEVYKNAHKEW